MANRLVYEGKTNVYWLTACANIAAPTAAEVAAGTALTSFVAKDGVATNLTTNNVDSATIAETFDAQQTGSWGAEIELTMFRDATADTAWNLCVYGTAGFLVIDRFRNSGTLPIATNKVEVWPAQMHQPAPENSASNTMQRFVEKFAVTSQPNLKAVVA
jgi:hypothetical protein